jgi:hypothetical protein
MISFYRLDLVINVNFYLYFIQYLDLFEDAMFLIACLIIPYLFDLRCSRMLQSRKIRSVILLISHECLLEPDHHSRRLEELLMKNIDNIHIVLTKVVHRYHHVTSNFVRVRV